MERNQLEKHISSMLDNTRFCSFATVEGGKPHVRYMTVYHDGLTIYLATNRKSHKVEELDDNPHVHILTELKDDKPDEFLQIEATATVTKDDSLRHKVWNDWLKPWFEGPDDPDYVILEVKPSRIAFAKDMNVQVWEA
ncbi:pyridoxamine 5'-phosphate oxidase family protein [Paenibacillus aurantius]|uniref:Pyridoxamine 5'-phosphate oxidase family protein n=1 Tax=Paenibacillus aurantius TaxID=2918900 RepID=A0AA96LHK3_9BACL|nr:pyridoxamine 5'-phosphate oxidase family protein [Paenibacillus aurantius]WNQ12185.1 pyridoxamine 5'-phosphate oxidase family protein [Paenibacillus aurantius]